MKEIIYILGVLLLLPYVIVPILIKRHQKFAVTPRIRLLFEGFLPTSVENYFIETKDHLSSLGFEQRIDVVSLDYGPNLKVFMRFFVAAQESIVAIATSLVPEGEKISIRNFLEFSSRFIDGCEVSTHNSDLALAPIEPPQKTTSAFPLISDVDLLLACHRSIIQQPKFAGKQPIIPGVGDELELLVETCKTDLFRQYQLGCLALDKDNKHYRPTWAGAFLMAWYSMWPVNQLRLWRQKMRAKTRLKSVKKA